MSARFVSRILRSPLCPIFLLACLPLAFPPLSSCDPIFGARVSHMTVPQGSDDPKLSIQYWSYREGAEPPAPSPGQESMVMTDGSTGRRHVCLIPNISSFGVPQEDEELQGSPGQGGAHTLQWQGMGSTVEEGDTRKTPEELLDAMRGLPCSYKMEGWWTYEFCYKDKIRQLHFEPAQQNKLVITMEFVLGLYDHAASTEAQQKYEASLAALSPEERSLKKRYHVQVYSGGTPCDLTGVPRKTEVRYLCDDSFQVQEQGQKPGQPPQHQGHASYIKSHKEAPTCVYELHFVSSLLCAHREFRTVKQPVNVINCYEMREEEEPAATGGEAHGATELTTEGVETGEQQQGEESGFVQDSGFTEESGFIEESGEEKSSRGWAQLESEGELAEDSEGEEGGGEIEGEEGESLEGIGIEMGGDDGRGIEGEYGVEMEEGDGEYVEEVEMEDGEVMALEEDLLQL